MEYINEIILSGIIINNSRNPIENTILNESIVELYTLGEVGKILSSQKKIGLNYINMISRKENILLELKYKDYKITVNKDIETGTESITVKIENTKKIHHIDVSFLENITWLEDKETFDKAIKDLV